MMYLWFFLIHIFVSTLMSSKFPPSSTFMTLFESGSKFTEGETEKHSNPILLVGWLLGWCKWAVPS